MKVYRSLSEFTPLDKAIVTVGTFDGVHLGHKTILKRINEIAQKENGESVVLTFNPHPRMVLFPDDNDLVLLNTLDEKIAQLENAGLNHLIIHPFTIDFSRTTVREYVSEILCANIGVHKLVIGYDHHFGRNREGNLKNLKDLAPLNNFTVEEIPAQDIDSVNVSSTKIRKALLDGDVSTAKTYLQYSYPLTGTVVHGNKIGRELAFPTANIKVTDKHKLIPANGVYVVRVLFEGKEYQGMASLGVRPTIIQKKQEHAIEVNIFDFDQEIYGRELTLLFEKWIRPEEKFKDMEMLKKQLEKDREEAKAYFN